MPPLQGRPLEIVRDGKNHADVAVLTPDGTIQTVISWVDADDAGNVTLNSAEGRSWPQNLREAGRCTLTVRGDESPYEYVSIRADLIEASRDEADEHIDALAQKYLGESTYPYRQPGEQRIKFTLAPSRVIHQSQG